VGPITDDIIATQQGVADRFFKLGLIPKTGRGPRRGLEAGADLNRSPIVSVKEG